MNDTMTRGEYGTLVEPATLKIERLLPGPVERVWAYLTDSDMRRRWLASGTMELKAGAPFELTWRNDELTDPPGSPPDGKSGEHTAQCRMLAVDPPHSLSFVFGSAGEVTIELHPKGRDVLLVLIHRRVPDRGTLLGVSAGWHAHLDVLVARARSEEPKPFWDEWGALRKIYEARLPG